MKNERSPTKDRPKGRKVRRDQQKAGRVADDRRATKDRTAPIAAPPDGTPLLGPYETTYPVSEGYGVERDIVQP